MSLRFIISAMILATICIIPTTVSESEATQKIAIELSKSCQASPNCPTWSDLLPYDNSNQMISGKFVKVNGKDVRHCSNIKNSLAWYDYNNKNKTVIFVDPCYKESIYMHRITIVPSLDNYHTKDQMKVKEIGNIKDFKPIQNIRTISHTRSVQNCDQAVITAKDWKPLLDDTIQYLLTGCGETKYKTTSDIIQNITKHDIATSSKYKLEQYAKYVKENCLKARNSCTPPDNKAVSTMGDQK